VTPIASDSNHVTWPLAADRHRRRIKKPRVVQRNEYAVRCCEEIRAPFRAASAYANHLRFQIHPIGRSGKRAWRVIWYTRRWATQEAVGSEADPRRHRKVASYHPLLLSQVGKFPGWSVPADGSSIARKCLAHAPATRLFRSIRQDSIRSTQPEDGRAFGWTKLRFPCGFLPIVVA